MHYAIGAASAASPVTAASPSGLAGRLPQVPGDAGTQDMTLDERVLRAFAESSVETARHRREIEAAVADPRVSADPALLLGLQQATAQHAIDVSMTATLVRKATAAVETLLR